MLKGRAGSPTLLRIITMLILISLLVQQIGLEFEALIARTHKAGLKLIIDIVPNHIARKYGKTIQKSEGLWGK
jgi:hypothetical protein